MAIKLTHPQHDCIEETALFSTLSTNEKECVKTSITYFEYQPGEVIFDEYENTDALILLHHGSIKVSQLSTDGREHTLYYLKTGDIDGEAGLVEGAKRLTQGIALTTCRVCLIKRDSFVEIMIMHAELGLALTQAVSKKMLQLQEHQLGLVSESVEERIYHFLEELAVQEGSLTFKLPMAKKEMAAFLGTVPATLSRQLTELEHKRLISRGPKGQITLNVIKSIM